MRTTFTHLVGALLTARDRAERTDFMSNLGQLVVHRSVWAPPRRAAKRSSIVSLTGILTLVAPALLGGCGGAAGEVVRPTDYKGGDALGGEATTCGGAPRVARPFTVDLDTDTRGDLEAQMDQGLVVVSYDCKNLRVLSNCKFADGNYDYAGVSRKEEVVQIKGMEELKINLPIGAAKLGSEVQAGRTIDLGLVAVGRRTTTVIKVEKKELTGECTGATHYVQRASLGAFSIATGSVGKVAAVADMFSVGGSASSSSERKAASSDGSLDACRKSQRSAKEPPSECRAPLRLTLTPILADAATAAAAIKKDDDKKVTIEGEANPCPGRYKLVGGRCSLDAAAGYLCDPQDEQECRAQCDKGSFESCTNLGAYLLEHGSKDPKTWEASIQKATSFFKKACDGGHVEGCAGYALALYPLELDDKEELARAKASFAIARKACDDGSADACMHLAVELSNGSFDETTMPPAYRESVDYARRACALGDGWGCSMAADDLMDPPGDAFPKDPTLAVTMAKRGCDGGTGYVCTKLADWLLQGKVVPKDEVRGLRAARNACTLDAEECFPVADWVKKAGKDAEAFDLLKRGCEVKADNQFVEEACTKLGDFYAAGTGTAKDPSKAKAAWTAGCEAAKEAMPESFARSAACRRMKR